MDTREKIVRGSECAVRLTELRQRRGSVRVVSGYFDPVLPDHCLRLEEASAGASAVAVVVLDPPDPILPVKARAELMASLEGVALVLLPEGSDLPAADAHLEQADLETRARFEAYVRERQS